MQKNSLFAQRCKENNVEHRLTKPGTPKTNGMVERANGVIKSNTILKNEYTNIENMNQEIIKFLIFYNIYRRHGSLRKELNVKTPLDAVEKWYELKPEIFKEKPCSFKNKILCLQLNNSNLNQQPCET